MHSKILCPARKRDRILSGPELDRTPEGVFETGGRDTSRVSKRDTNGLEGGIGQLPRDPDQRGRPELDLVAIGMSRQSDISEMDAKAAPKGASHHNPFVVDRAVSLGA